MPYYGVDVNLSIVIEADSDDEAVKRANAIHDEIKVGEPRFVDDREWWPDGIDNSSLEVVEVGTHRQVL